MVHNGKQGAAKTAVDKTRWWKIGDAGADNQPHPSQGQPCPKCYLADLDFDTLFRLHCPNCGFIAHGDRDPRDRDGSRAGDGYARQSTQLASAVSIDDTTITVDSTTGFTSPSTGSITAFANVGYPDRWTTVTSASHGLIDGEKINISGTTSYNGNFRIANKTSTPFCSNLPSPFFTASAVLTSKKRHSSFNLSKYSLCSSYSSSDASAIPS